MERLGLLQCVNNPKRCPETVQFSLKQQWHYLWTVTKQHLNSFLNTEELETPNSLEQWEQKRNSLASDFKTYCRVILSKPAGAVIKTAAKPSGTLTIKKSKMEIHDGESKCKTWYYKKTLLKKRRITQRDWHKHLLCLEKDPQTHKTKANNKRSCIKLRRFCTKKQPKKGNDNQVEYSCKLCICQRINIHNI